MISMIEVRKVRIVLVLIYHLHVSLLFYDVIIKKKSKLLKTSNVIMEFQPMKKKQNL